MPIIGDLELLERNVQLPDGHLPAAGPGAAQVDSENKDMEESISIKVNMFNYMWGTLLLEALH